ncbi:MAG: histidine phosphatase family protein [Cyclobacteriaceae bacterium]|nr:histidine phosphatase family protein [Cyclobacteriaceae bacterium]
MRTPLFISLLTVLLATGCTNTTKKTAMTTIYLVRHAEKELNETDDPGLTDKGNQRAQYLVQFFQQVKFDAIYSSPFKRTLLTAGPLAIKNHLDTQTYDPKELEEFASMLVQKHNGQTVLVVGHSNTTPALANLLGNREDLRPLEEYEYDWIYVVDRIGDISSVKKLYVKPGEPTP